MESAASRKPSYRNDNGEMYVYGMHITPYEKGNICSTKTRCARESFCMHNAVRSTKLDRKMSRKKAITIVPLQVYFKGGLRERWRSASARGKKLYDKRQDIAKKDQRREVEREFKVKNLY